jgi:putative ABC transport system permease protein
MKSFKMAFRSLLKNRLITLINIMGLTAGITVSLLCFMFVEKENSTDRYISDFQDIYLITNNEGSHMSSNMVHLIRKNVQSIQSITICNDQGWNEAYFKHNNTSYRINKLLAADSSFFKVFEFEPLWGDPSRALNASNKVVITQSFSQKMFGDENPVGKTIGYNSAYMPGEYVEVEAVIKDLPHNSSWTFDAVISVQTNFKLRGYQSNMESWGAQNYRAFCKINPGLDEAEFKTLITQLPLNEVPDEFLPYVRLGVLPFSQVYFNQTDIDFMNHGNRFALSIMTLIGILIVLLACINYINLVTAQREKRFKNIGIFKTLGSSKRKIIELLAAESMLLVLIAILFSLILATLLLGSFNHLTGSHFTVESFLSADNIIIIAFLFIGTVLISGLIPGLIFSKQNTIMLLKKQNSKNQNNFLRNGLLIFQFAISIALITGVLIITRQNQYISSLSTGFEKENIIYARTNAEIRRSIQSFKNEITKIPSIVDVTFSAEPIGMMEQNWTVEFMNREEKSKIYFAKFTVSPNFFEFFGIPVKEGRTFNENSYQKQDWIFNEKAARGYDIKTLAEARVISAEPDKGEIIGISGDFNFESLHVPVRAAAFRCSDECDNIIHLKINASAIKDFQKTLESIENVWNHFSPNFPFEMQFLDASWNSLYAKELQFQKIFAFTTIISLILSCLGLVGLTFYIMERRTKEIGIRKVNGAKISEILVLLNRDFIKWVAVAFVIAAPVAYFAMQKWLVNFAYKTSLSWWIFALAGLLALGVAVLTVSWQSWRAATRNPVEALRYE